MNYEIMVMGIIAFITFIVAAMHAFLRYRKTKKITHIWSPITIALLLFALSALIQSIKYISGLNALESVAALFLIVGSTLLCCALCLYRKERELAKDGKDGKLKERDGKKYEEIERWLGGI